ncbi:MAG: hypothetical protein SFU91_08200 [Chloroherpetonaceae bacterium]|nr:hypothetical protein [Chloroherpetonaceae bacterium]
MKLLLFSFLILFSSLAFAQNQSQDVVYLKNGSIIRGSIIELIPEKTITIETIDGSKFIFKMAEVEKITKEDTRGDNASQNQSTKKTGYLGLTLGPSIPVGDFAERSNGLATTGLQLNLINMGYLFTRNYGIAGIWFGGANPLGVSGFDPWSYGGLVVGPMVSFPIGKRIEWDFRAMVGSSLTTLPNIGAGEEDAYSFAFSLGAVLRINIGENFALMSNIDYFSTSPKFERLRIEQKITTVSICFGLAYRI